MSSGSNYFTKSIHDFFAAVFNLFIFLPYFFSVSTLLKTLFTPWKNLTATKTKQGFSFEEWGSRVAFNLISRGIGFVMRVSIILFYVFFLVFFVILVPVVFILFIVFLPILFLISLFSKTDAEKKILAKEHFLSSHLIKQENSKVVEAWFEERYEKIEKQSQWWLLPNLFSTPPLARDWSMGYTPTLEEYAIDLTHEAYQSGRNHLIGRQKEFQIVEQTLSRSEEANVILVGDEGVGKHAIIDAFTRKIYEGKTNNLLAYKRVVKLNMEKVLNKFVDQQQRESFFEELLYEAYISRNIILVIENFDKYVSHGEDRFDLSIAIEKYAKTAGLQIIGVTTPFAYEKFIYPNEKIGRLFAKVQINEVSRDEALQILLQNSESYEQRYRLYLPYETLQAAMEKSDFFITDIPFPEKAFQLLDNACVYTLQTLKKRIVMPETIDKVLTDKTHVPTTMNDQIKSDLLNLEQLLSARVINQAPAISEVSSALRRSFLLYGKRKKPLATFLFLGPTGVGKTETAKAIADVFFGTAKELIRFDMSLYQSKTDINKLIGDSATQSPGLLTNAVRQNPYGVLLLDELEKANHDLLNIFLTIFDEGYFTDGLGSRVDCKNLVIIATSNAGADYIYATIKMEDDAAKKLASNDVISYLVAQKIFAPEFLNRFDGVVAFNPLMEDSALIIARKILQNIINEIYGLYKVKVIVSDETIRSVTKEGYDPAFGARNMERVIRQEIEDKVAKMILEGKSKEGDTIEL